MNKLFLLLLIFSHLNVFAQENTNPRQLYKFKYVTRAKDKIARIYLTFVHPNSVITKKTPMTQMTLKNNLHIADWNNIEEGQIIDVYVQKDFLDIKKFEKYQEKMRDEISKRKAQTETENSGPGMVPEGWKASVYYLVSYGRFTQKDPDRANVEFYQNSPITLGISGSYYPKKSNWSYATSAYGSYHIAKGNNLDDSGTTVAPEFGLTFHPEYRFNKYQFTGFFGIDIEKFNTFNMGGIQNDQKLILDENIVTYATIGFAKLVHVFDSPFFTKAAFSHSIASKNIANSDGIDTEGSFSGYKLLWYMNKKLNDRLYISTLFKYHAMSGPSDLETLRIGVGLGYILY